jgi:hypothetical protein
VRLQRHKQGCVRGNGSARRRLSGIATMKGCRNFPVSAVECSQLHEEFGAAFIPGRKAARSQKYRCLTGLAMSKRHQRLGAACSLVSAPVGAAVQPVMAHACTVLTHAYVLSCPPYIGPALHIPLSMHCDRDRTVGTLCESTRLSISPRALK